MPLQATVLLLALINVAGLGVVAFFQYKGMLAQQKMIMNIAMFKKSSEPWHVQMLGAAMDARDQKEEEVQPDPMEESVIPNNPSDSAMDNLRKMI